MVKFLVVYSSQHGKTEEMGSLVAAGAEEGGVEVVTKSTAETEPEDFRKSNGIIIGSPTHYGLPEAGLMKLLCETVSYHGALEGKVGGAFSSSANIGGGNETTIMALIQAMLVHGMIVKGSPTGDHYGPVAVGQVDRRVTAQCRAYGKSLAELALKLFNVEVDQK